MRRDHFKPLPSCTQLLSNCHLIDSYNPPAIQLDDPAIDVMTDLRRIPAATIGPDSGIAEANHRMLSRGVRLLFVTASNHRVLGIITCADLSGEKPVTTASSRGCRVLELSVRDIMSPIDMVDLLDLETVVRAEVGHIVATLKAHGRCHALVVTRCPIGAATICGIFSESQIARQLGTSDILL